MRFLLLFFSAVLIAQEPLRFSEDELSVLKRHSMLYQSPRFTKLYSGKKTQWQDPYGLPNPKKAIELGSVWFTAYPMSTITGEQESVLQVLGSPELWDVFSTIGIEAIHTGPMKIAGGLENGIKTPTVDGYFDRIGYEIDPVFGTEHDYLNMVKVVQNHHAIVIGDLVPGHTGLGYDFYLALCSEDQYPGIYHMVEINSEHWHLLPEVSPSQLSQNLPMKTVKLLKQKGYIVGPLETQIFFDPHTKVSNWDATCEVEGADGKIRRYVYLHYFKSGQPSLNWLDPSFAAQRIIAGDIIQSIHFLENKVLRLDANPFLGVEISLDKEKAWSEAHPLSIASSDIISMLIRKLGGFSFQELNMPLEDIRALSELGSDLTYDFVTRAAYLNALVNQDDRFLHLMLNLMKKNQIPLHNFVHALQNHDEFNYDLVQFKSDSHRYFYDGMEVSGTDLREKIREHDLEKLCSPQAWYNPPFDTGIASTMVGLCAAALGIKDLNHLSAKEKDLIKQAHLLLACFNAMQPGVFAISGWDLVGAYPLEQEEVSSMIESGDMRWINRGAYDLLGNHPRQQFSDSGIPKARTLYGPINTQLKNSDSFVSKLKQLLEIRKHYKLDLGTLKECPKLPAKALFALMFELPDHRFMILCLNFSQEDQEDVFFCHSFKNAQAKNLITNKFLEKTEDQKGLRLYLKPLEYQVILLE